MQQCIYSTLKEAILHNEYFYMFLRHKRKCQCHIFTIGATSFCYFFERYCLYLATVVYYTLP